MSDRIMVQVRFKKLLWVCPSCGQEDVVDANPSGGNTYEHNCSACDQWFNSFKTYDGMLTIPQEEFDKKTEQDIVDDKTAQFDGWLYEVKNPPVVVEPSKEDLQSLYEQKVTEANRQLEILTEKLTSEELAVVKASIDAQSAELSAQIGSKITEKVAVEEAKG